MSAMLFRPQCINAAPTRNCRQIIWKLQSRLILYSICTPMKMTACHMDLLHSCPLKRVIMIFCTSQIETWVAWTRTAASCNRIHFDHSNSLRPRQNGRHFEDDIFKCIFFNENCCILVNISLKYNRKGPIGDNPALVYIMAWHRTGDKTLSEPMIV